MLLDHLARDYLVRVVHQVFEQSELFWREINRSAFSLDTMCDRIDHHFHGQPPGLIGLLAAQQGTQARQQFTHGKGLHQVIISAAVQPLDAIINAITRCQQQKRRMNAAAAQVATDLQSIFDGQQNVQITS